jgi:apolipoprotein D and lipocalin family protein
MRLKRVLAGTSLPLVGALALIGVLASCAPKPSAPEVRRDPKVRISSAVIFEPARFAGDWRVVASHTPGCVGAAQHWQQAQQRGTPAYVLSGTDCTGPRPARLSGAAVVTGPGARFTPDTGFDRDPVYVMWVDQDYRIAALGTPSGGWAMILARDSVAGRPDLTAAAREVLAFNGYDLSKLAAK